MAKGRVEKTRIGVGVIKSPTKKTIVLPDVKGPVRANDQFHWSSRRVDSTAAREILGPARTSTP